VAVSRAGQERRGRHEGVDQAAVPRGRNVDRGRIATPAQEEAELDHVAGQTRIRGDRESARSRHLPPPSPVDRPVVLMQDRPIDSAAGPAVQATLPRLVDQARRLGYCFGLPKGSGGITAVRLRSSHARIPR
jgi:hypothetical protein